MVREKIGAYIPFITTVSERGPFGGYGRLKRYTAKVFAKPDDGAMTLGVVKKVEIIVNKKQYVITKKVVWLWEMRTQNQVGTLCQHLSHLFLQARRLTTTS